MLAEFRRKTLIQDQYRAAFFKMPQREQLKTLVARAVIDVYGSSWTTPESRDTIAEAAAVAQDAWDAELARIAAENSLNETLDTIELYETNDPWAPGGSDHHYFVRYGTNKAATTEIPVEVYEVLQTVMNR